MHPILEGIRRRPGMYFGHNPNRYSCLLGYLVGFCNGYDEAARIQLTPAAVRLVPDAFSDFAARHFGHESAGSASWEHWIRLHSADDQAAFDTFFELLAAYDQQSPHAA